MSGSYEHDCQICGHAQRVPTYGNFTCEQCGQEYVYDENHFLCLSDEQIKTLRALQSGRIAKLEAVAECARKVVAALNSRSRGGGTPVADIFDAAVGWNEDTELADVLKKLDEDHPA